MLRKKTKAEQIELCYRQTSYSQAFKWPRGFDNSPDNWHIAAARNAENKRNKKWAKIYRENKQR
jgi:hypothetical protein